MIPILEVSLPTVVEVWAQYVVLVHQLTITLGSLRHLFGRRRPSFPKVRARECGRVDLHVRDSEEARWRA